MTNKYNQQTETLTSENSCQLLRRQAEENENESIRSPLNIDSISPEESRRLHDLLALKIELEIQSNELRHEQELLEVENERVDEHKARLEERRAEVAKLAIEQ